MRLLWPKWLGCPSKTYPVLVWRRSKPTKPAEIVNKNDSPCLERSRCKQDYRGMLLPTDETDRQAGSFASSQDSMPSRNYGTWELWSHWGFLKSNHRRLESKHRTPKKTLKRKLQNKREWLPPSLTPLLLLLKSEDNQELHFHCAQRRSTINNFVPETGFFFSFWRLYPGYCKKLWFANLYYSVMFYHMTRVHFYY